MQFKDQPQFKTPYEEKQFMSGKIGSPVQKMEGIPSGCLKMAIMVLLFVIAGLCSITYGASDTTLFRIKVLEDTVYTRDTVHVDLYIGDGKGGLLDVLNLLNEFEIEVATDTSLIDQGKTKFAFDKPSLSSFFGTWFTNIQTSSALDPVLGKLDIKAKSNKTGHGDARVGQGQYIVQDNAAGRQQQSEQMIFSFTKSISKGLLGLINPVKVQIDSVVVVGKYREPTPIIKAPAKSAFRMGKVDGIKVYPNPATDYIQIEGADLKQYKLLNMDGRTIVSETNVESGLVRLHVIDLIPGFYILLLKDSDDWNTYKIVKQ